MGNAQIGGARNVKWVCRWVTDIIMALWLFNVAGCAEHRISTEEFIAMQEETKLNCPATTQPTPNRQRVVAELDRSFGPYRVGKADVLAITLITALEQTTNPSPPILVRVDRNGQIMLPMVGNITVEGLKLNEVDEAIRHAYVPKVYRDIAAYVDVPRPENTSVLVTGAVTNPGLIPLRHTERNLLFAIIGSGGVTDAASGMVTLKRIRSPEKELTLNLYDPRDMQAALTMAPLENGDMITVKTAMPNMIFVGGLVNMPQVQSYPPGAPLTVLQALAASGGLRTDIFPHEATLIRRMSDGKDVQVKLNLDRIQTGKDPNLSLAAGDILWVPFTWDTRVEDWINQHIYIRGGTAANVSYNATGIEYLNRRDQQSQGTSGGNSSDLQSTYDPFGFLNRNAALQNLTQTTTGQ